MSTPYKGEGRGIAMLNLLSTLSHSIAPAMADMWELEIPLLIKYLEGEAARRPPGANRPLGVQAGVRIPWLEQQELRFQADQHSLCGSLARWGGRCRVWRAGPWRASRPGLTGCPRRMRQKTLAGATLLSAEHTEFTWNQKTWEDKLIQVKRRPSPTRPRWGEQLGGWPVGSLGAPRGHVHFPSVRGLGGCQACPQLYLPAGEN